jgi:hypothetical protein
MRECRYNPTHSELRNYEYMGVTGQLQPPAPLPSEKERPVLEAGWAAEPFWTLWKRENFMCLSEVLNNVIPVLCVIKHHTVRRGGVVTCYLPWY